MQPNEIKALLEAGIKDARAEVSSDGYHVQVTVISPAFENLRPVPRQQLVYRALGEHIASGAIHAVQMKTLTPAEANS